MKNIQLGKIKTCFFDQQYLVLGFSDKWLKVNNGEPLEFDVKIDKGCLVLSSPLTLGERTKEVKNVM